MTLKSILLLLSLYLPSLLAISPIIGIDFGTDWIKVGIIKPGVPFEIVLNRDSKRKTANILNIRGLERTFGSDALNLNSKYPETSFPALKYLIGKFLDDDIVQSYRKHYFNQIKTSSDSKDIEFFINDNSSYTLKELLAMILFHIKEISEEFIKEKVQDITISIPTFYNYHERQVLLEAAKLTNLNVLSLIHDGSAISINYAMTRKFSETPKKHLFFDMGSGNLQLTLSSFQKVNVKEGKFNRTTTQIEIQGFTYDRNLGGKEIDFLFRDYLLEEFLKLYPKYQESIHNSPKTLMKLLKEATRVKEILSANTETFASIESFYDEVDFKLRVNRKNLQDLCRPLIERIRKPITDVLNQAKITKDDLESVILFGGSVRMPFIQSILRDYFGEEKIAQNINGDEAAAIGAAFRGAAISKKFVVKDITLKDLTLYPIDVVYESDNEKGKIYRTPIFKQLSPIHTKKIVNFKKSNDFAVDVEYSKIEEFSDLKDIHRIAQVDLLEISEKINEFNNVTLQEPPKVKLSLQMNEMGMLSVQQALLVLNTTFTTEVPITLSSSSVETPTESIESLSTESDQVEETPTSSTETSTSSESQESPIVEMQSIQKVKIEKIPLKTSFKLQSIKLLSDEEFQVSKQKLDELSEEEHRVKERAEAFNNLESFVYQLQDFVSDELVIQISLEEERDAILTLVNSISEWLYEEGDQSSIEEIQNQQQKLKDLHTPLEFRQKEFINRPERIEKLRNHVEEVYEFLTTYQQNHTAEELEHVEKELNDVVSELQDVENWLKQKISEQDQLLPTQEPVLLTQDLEQRYLKLTGKQLSLAMKKIPKKIRLSKTVSEESTLTDGEASSTSFASETETPSQIKDDHDEL